MQVDGGDAGHVFDDFDRRGVARVHFDRPNGFVGGQDGVDAEQAAQLKRLGESVTNRTQLRRDPRRHVTRGKRADIEIAGGAPAQCVPMSCWLVPSRRHPPPAATNTPVIGVPTTNRWKYAVAASLSQSPDGQSDTPLPPLLWVDFANHRSSGGGGSVTARIGGEGIPRVLERGTQPQGIADAADDLGAIAPERPPGGETCKQLGIVLQRAGIHPGDVLIARDEAFKQAAGVVVVHDQWPGADSAKVSVAEAVDRRG